MFARLFNLIRQVLHRMLPYKSIQQAESIESPLAPEMITALEDWQAAYINKPAWKQPEHVHTLNLPAQIAAEVARQVTLEMKWSITGKGVNEDGDAVTNKRSEYLAKEFEKVLPALRLKLEQGMAAGGMVIKPYPNPKDGHIHFDFLTDWDIFPIGFDDDGNLQDIVLPDVFMQGKTVYTRLERHTLTDEGVRITQRAFKSNDRNSIGTEIFLSDVPQWAKLQPETLVKDSEGQLFGWYKVAAANNIDIPSPMGVSVFAKALELIEQADIQYSRLLWEFEGGELAVDVDPQTLRPAPIKDGNGKVVEIPRLNDRLFRGVDLGSEDNYHVFSPTLRDASLIAGLNQILIKIEDASGLARGTFSDANVEARTATELTITHSRTYTTVADNQAALEHCLQDVVRAMSKYADLYNLAPPGDYELSIEWDDSIITDTNAQLQERLLLLDKNIISPEELRQWYFGETKTQAKQAIQAIEDRQIESMQRAMEASIPNPAPDEEITPPGTE